MFFVSQLAAAVLGTFGIKHAIDVGSGQGHLSRFLALCYQINVATVEAEESHLSSAANFDKQVWPSAVIINMHCKSNMNVKKLETKIVSYFKICIRLEIFHHIQYHKW